MQAFPIVGIGASAGGLDAIKILLQNLPVDTGLAFVVPGFVTLRSAMGDSLL